MPLKSPHPSREKTHKPQGENMYILVLGEWLNEAEEKGRGMVMVNVEES